MKILGVDSTATAASVAVYEDGKIRSLIYSNTGLTHSQTLMPMVEAALKSAGVDIKDINLFAVSNGPGSFTGVRIGVSAVKGLAQPLNKNCVAVSTLEVIAKPLENTGCYAVAVMDARCNQVYTAQFDCDSGFKRVTEDEAITIDELTEKLLTVSKPIVLIGDGAHVTYNKMIEKIPFVKKAVASVCYQSAADVALIAAEKVEAGINSEQTANDILPNYLRLSQAERELKKKNNN
ncbi:MAG: tRNA (adenosine(37)-N6)-threonylcarbamoyltransferase complex dimerization subunit type 1 TsaB [Clostridia bacterium]|nr:tRNA (adenosine(37)-N6)-threonylcarbamoyltransferase complex dimerization subunit type 1 TsaB [Clostridia bacterium]MBO5290138.1 tRNA (adenosine(37)-N6)-threonylcarbamoyltransferase complex dimerization subunit type 1 TsaB [Clostridia bacterium]